MWLLLVLVSHGCTFYPTEVNTVPAASLYGYGSYGPPYGYWGSGWPSPSALAWEREVEPPPVVILRHPQTHPSLEQRAENPTNPSTSAAQAGRPAPATSHRATPQGQAAVPAARAQAHERSAQAVHPGIRYGLGDFIIVVPRGDARPGEPPSRPVVSGSTPIPGHSAPSAAPAGPQQKPAAATPSNH